jgi:hypothetical protein
VGLRCALWCKLENATLPVVGTALTRLTLEALTIRLWHKADLTSVGINVRCWGAKRASTFHNIRLAKVRCLGDSVEGLHNLR